MLKPFKNIINDQSYRELCLLDNIYLSGKVIQNIDLVSLDVDFESIELRNTIFLDYRLRKKYLALSVGREEEDRCFSELSYDPY